MERQDLIFRVFVSSPFSDMRAERNALQERVFPDLRKYCQERGARFQAIDLRWGVGQEAALDQQTMNICIRELRRCQQLSPRPNFIVLLGNRYGWRPLPAQVEATEFESLLAKLTASEQNRVLGWYKRDDNAIPPEYCLLPRAGEFVDPTRWTQEELELRTILLKAVEQVPSPNDPERQKWYDSATHQEIRHGALEAENPKDHVFCYFREIDGLPGNDSAKEFCDIRRNAVDNEAQDRLDALKRELESLLPADHRHEYRVAWKEFPEWKRDALCEDVERDLKQVIDQEMAAFRQRPSMDREREAHREFAQDRCRHFVGRQDILQRIDQYLASDDKAPLIIHGKSGSGKTALLAQAIAECGKPYTEPGVAVISRFIGATPASSDLRSLLVDLCRELGVATIPQDMNDLVRTFRAQLSTEAEAAKEEEKTEQPPEPGKVVLFLDALDQLNPTDNARMLYWLPRNLKPNVKLVVSVLEGERQPAEAAAQAGTREPQAVPGSPAGSPSESAAHSALRTPHSAFREDPFELASRIWPGRLVELGGLDEAAGAQLLTTWLAEAHRTLQDPQRADVLGKFRVCPLPLYLKLAFGEARRWKSWDSLPPHAGAAPGLSGTVEGILEDLLTRLEEPRNHGQTLVGRALGYIAAGKNGLTEDELIDVLSADKGVMEWFYSQSPTEQAKDPKDRIKNLPVVIWSRLIVDIESYMTRRRADGTIVMDFYHRQVGEAVRKRYLAKDDARVQAHQHLAEYFHGLDYWAESLEAQRARAKRLPPTPRPANVRKVVELPYHRLEAAKLAGKDDPNSPYWDAVADLLTDWQFLEAKTEADPSFHEEKAEDPPTMTGEGKP